MTRISSLIIVTYMLTATVYATAQGSRRIPYIAEGGGWKTYLLIVNTCDRPAGFRLEFFNFNGEPAPIFFDFSAGEGLVSYWDASEFPVPANGAYPWSFVDEKGSNRSANAELFRAYGVFTNDGGGCISGFATYSMISGSRALGTSHQFKNLEAGWITRFNKHDYAGGCETAYAISGSGDPVSLELYTSMGELIARADLGNVHLEAFLLTQHFSTDIIYTREGVSAITGNMKVIGASTITGFEFCDGKLIERTLQAFPISSEGDEQ